MQKKPAPPNTSYVYILVRQDLPEPHRTIQACHATLAAINSFGNPHKAHPHLVVCAIESEKRLEDEFNRLKDVGVPCCAFYEEDFAGNPITAVATAPLLGPQRKPLRKYRLMS